jgi:L-alanine-DL-glutamate epimerase-like enolase superfamily enzyme
MKSLESIQVYRLKHPLRVPYKLAFGPVGHFDTLIVKIEDTEGKMGFGEATILTGYTDETIEGSWKLLQELAPILLQADEKTRKSLLKIHLPNNPFTVTALATALEMLSSPHLYEVAETKSVPILGVVNSEEAKALETEIDELLKAGFHTLKVKVGFDVDKDSHKVQIIQGIINNRAQIRVDGNQGYTRDQAMRFIKTLNPDGIELVEQLCHADDWDSALAIAKMSHVPLMLDESIYGEEDIYRAAEINAASFIKVKLMKFGSLEYLLHTLSLITKLGMKPVLGNGVAGEIGCWMEAIAASTHIQNAGEMNGYLKPTSSILQNPLKFADGSIVLEKNYLPHLDIDLINRFTTAQRQFH